MELPQKESEKLKEILDSTNNPLIYFDNDQDGLSSYLILKKYLKRGNGVPVKTSHLNSNYFKRVKEFNPDHIIILDKPIIDETFFNLVEKQNIPITWIDHHEFEKINIPKSVNYFNPLKSIGKNFPTTKICYDLFKNKEYLWLLITGCIADKYLPKEYTEFIKKYPELSIKSNSPFEIFFNSQIGKISRMMGAGLKDRTTNVMKMIKFLTSTKTPNEILEENNKINMYRKFNEINSKFNELIEKAKKNIDNSKLIFFRYGGKTSMSADLANKLSFLYPNKFVVVVYTEKERVNISIRSKNAKKIIEKAIKEIPYTTYGGHEEAIGAMMNKEDLNLFERNLRQILSMGL